MTTVNGIEARIQDLRKRKDQLRQGGGPERVDKQHQSGKLTARERVDRLVDPDTFQEIGMFAKHRATEFGMAGKDLPADGVVTGAGYVDGRLIHLASQDFTVGGGAAGEVHSDKVAEAMRLSLKTGSPFVFINDSGGARVQEGIDSLAGYGRVFYSNVMLPRSVPQVALICGPCAGGAAYSPALTDFIIQTRGAQMFITGPSVIKQVTGEVVTPDQLGGPAAQMSYSGVVRFSVANQPTVLAGAIDSNASDKAARFIRFCNAFNIPLLTFVDVPGFMPGVQQEYGGIIRHGAKMLFAYSAATVPKLTVIVRKAYGGAYIAMCSKDLGADRSVAWPTAEIAVMGAEGAAEIVFRNEIAKAEDQKAKRAELIELYRNAFANPYVAGARRLVDDIIEPAETRKYLAGALE